MSRIEWGVMKLANKQPRDWLREGYAKQDESKPETTKQDDNTELPDEASMTPNELLRLAYRETGGEG